MELNMETKIAILEQEIQQWEGIKYQATIRIQVGKSAGLGEQYMNEQMAVAERAVKMIDGLKQIIDDLKGGMRDAH